MSRSTAARFFAVAVFGLLAAAALGQQQDATLPAAPTAADPLVRLLLAKGVLTSQDAASLNAATDPQEQRRRLIALLRDKGLLTEGEVASLAPAPAAPERVLVATTSPVTVPMPAPAPQRSSPPAAVQQAQAALPAAPAKPAPIIAAIAPIRLLPIDPIKREGMIPDIKLGSGIRLKPYGFLKASLIYDTSSPRGDDMPLTGFLSDSGPDLSPEFHAKARSARIGLQMEGLDPSPNTAITGRFEADFEGNFSRADNRNISAIRSSMLSIRLAYFRIDHKFSAKTNFYSVFGQDWTPFGSSTIPNVVETTGLALGYGTLYERLPQMRFGVTRSLGGKSDVKITPEFAVLMPAFGNLPTDVGNQLGYGERQGADSAKPAVEARLVTQWQLDKAPGVAPAQLIFSFHRDERKAIVLAANVPAAFKAAFPSGASVSSDSLGYSAELQLPTRYLTLLAKYWDGKDLRFFFSSELYSNFNDTAGLTNTSTVASVDGASNVVFGFQNGVPVVAPQRGVRAQGGFLNLGFPLSRIFHANPAGRGAGWTAYLHYSYDGAFARDARRFAGGRAKSDWAAANLQYKLNSFTTFMFEQSLYRTRTANNSNADFNGLPLLRGIPSRYWQDIRSEFSTMFTF